MKGRWTEETGFAARLRDLREGRGMSKVDLADACNVSRNTIGNLESGRTEPTWPLVLRLAGALGVLVTDFLPQ